MNSTGVVRRIDDLGRIVIPKEIRRTLGIREGETLDISIDGDKIVLKKCSLIASTEEIVRKIGKLTSDIMKYKMLVTNRNKVCYSSDQELQVLLNKNIPTSFIKLIDNRENHNSEELETIIFEDLNVNGFFSVNPIISTNDCLGLVIIFSNKIISKSENDFCKLVAKLIGDKLDIT